MCLGRGPVDVQQAVAAARAVLQMEAIRACGTGDLPLDRERLTLAIRRTDLLLMHYADPGRWWQAERPLSQSTAGRMIDA
jgi:hypothetical protein